LLPNGLADIFKVDHWRYLFVTEPGERTAVSHAKIISLMQRFADADLGVNLYNFDGKIRLLDVSLAMDKHEKKKNIVCGLEE
jgi:hypothetical protein